MSQKTSKINHKRYAALMSAIDKGEEGIREYDERVKKQDEKKAAQKLKVQTSPIIFLI